MRNRWASWSALLLVAGVVLAEDRPLQTLPYTPGLDVTAMDRTVDPCVDFYRYSCGGWIATNPIPPRPVTLARLPEAVPELDRIAALRSVKGLPALLAREHLELFGADVLFGYGSNQDFAGSNQVIGFADAGGLGLPDRDYYTNTDARSEEIQEEIRRARAADADADRRIPRAGFCRCDDRDADRDRARRGVADPRRPARSLQALPQDDSRRNCRR